MCNDSVIRDVDKETATTISLDIPREIVHAVRLTPLELKRELALSLFVQGKLSFGQAREMAEMSVWTFQQWLGVREIPVHYDLEDYAQDLETIGALGRSHE